MRVSHLIFTVVSILRLSDNCKTHFLAYIIGDIIVGFLTMPNLYMAKKKQLKMDIMQTDLAMRQMHKDGLEQTEALYASKDQAKIDAYNNGEALKIEFD